jgi:hypothetical protein
MKTEETFVERRKHKRYVVGYCTYAVLRPPATTIGQIVDISLSGLAFQYFSPNGDAMQYHSLDILAAEGLCLENISYELIDDITIPNDVPFSELKMYRHCIKFNGLTDHQKRQIQSFINTHTTTDTGSA